jgi:ATP-dependent exoDNAse (exonuclease V) alpha subunit
VTPHVLRVRLNRELQEHYKPTDRECFWVKAGPSKAKNTLPQDMWLWQGQKVICASTGHNFRDRWPYIIVELNERTAVLEAEGLGERTSAMSHALVVEKFRPAWAITIHSSQGLTFDCRVRIWGWSHTAIFTKEHLHVAMSRCTRAELLDFGSQFKKTYKKGVLYIAGALAQRRLFLCQL